MVYCRLYMHLTSCFLQSDVSKKDAEDAVEPVPQISDFVTDNLRKYASYITHTWRYKENLTGMDAIVLLCYFVKTCACVKQLHAMVGCIDRRYHGAIQQLYTGVGCSSCGLRFNSEAVDKYTEHLDWHFHQNQREKDEMKVAKCRQWYYDMVVCWTTSV